MNAALLWLAACRWWSPEPPTSPEGARDVNVIQPATRDPERWSAARCNDGSPFAYTHRTGPTKTWVINIAGGHFCDDAANPCAERKPRLTTTLPFADGATGVMKGHGVFDLDPDTNPDFADAHHVEAHYCSSDLWLGDSTERRATTGDPSGWYFSGRHNFRALLESLSESTSFDLHDPSTRVLLLGTSAGGAGVVGNLDAVREVWAPLAQDGRLKVVLDGSWVAALPEGVTIPDADRWGPVHRACDVDHRTRGLDPGACVAGPAWWPYVAESGVPVLIQIAGIDTTHVAAFDFDEAEQEAWADVVKRSLMNVPWVWSARRRYHVVAIDASFDRGPQGSSFRDLLGRFWRGGSPEQVWLNDEAAKP